MHGKNKMSYIFFIYTIVFLAEKHNVKIINDKLDTLIKYFINTKCKHNQTIFQLKFLLAFQISQSIKLTKIIYQNII